MTSTPTGTHEAASGGLTTVRGTGTRSGCTRRCLAGQSPLPERAVLVKPGFLKIILVAEAACRWYRPFAFGEQRGDWFTGRAERYLDDPWNWPTPTDCPAKIRQIAANPRPQDRDTHFGSRN